MVTAVPRDQGGRPLGGLPPDTLQQMAVGVDGDGDRAVPEAFRHQGYVDARGEHQRRRAVAQVVQPDRTQLGGDGELAEPLGDVVERHRVAVLAGEHEPVVDVRAPPRGPLGVLREPMREQNPQRAAVKLDDARLPRVGLRRAERVPAVHHPARRARDVGGDLDELLPDDENTTGEVDVGPAEPARLAAAQPGGGDQFEQPGEPVTAEAVEERAQLGRLPRRHLRARRSR